jgi:hypothetical protein
MVQEAVSAAAEEADDGRGGRQLCSVFFSQSDFNPIFFLTVTATNTECQGNGAVSSCQAHPGLVVLVTVLDAPSSVSVGCIIPVTVAVYVAVAVSAAVTIAADDVFSVGPFS